MYLISALHKNHLLCAESGPQLSLAAVSYSLDDISEFHFSGEFEQLLVVGVSDTVDDSNSCKHCMIMPPIYSVFGENWRPTWSYAILRLW